MWRANYLSLRDWDDFCLRLLHASHLRREYDANRVVLINVPHAYDKRARVLMILSAQVLTQVPCKSAHTQLSMASGFKCEFDIGVHFKIDNELQYGGYFSRCCWA